MEILGDVFMYKTKHYVDGKWLVRQLDNSDVIIIDCRFQLADPSWGETVYQASHIPGAYYLNLDRDLSSEIKQHGGRHPLPDLDLLAKKFTDLGIVKNKTLVVAYDNSRFAFAARLWWLLRYLGHDQVVVLDGGWDGWLKDDYPVSDTIPQSKIGDFTISVQPNWLVDIEKVKEAAQDDNYVVVDSRDRDRYKGLREPIDPVAGSIPGAVNSPWKQVSDSSGYLIAKDQQKQLWQDYQQASEIIVYCGSGVTACVNLFSLNLLGIKNTKLYPGGWSDWCSYLD